MQKQKTKPVHYLPPHIIIQKERIPPVTVEDYFTYLGKNFNFNMDTSAIKASLETDVTRYIKVIDKLPINALNKTEIVQRYLFSKVKWRF